MSQCVKCPSMSTWNLGPGTPRRRQTAVQALNPTPGETDGKTLGPCAFPLKMIYLLYTIYVMGVDICVPHARSTLEDQRRALDPLGLETGGCEWRHVGCGSQTWVFWKRASARNHWTSSLDSNDFIFNYCVCGGGHSCRCLQRPKVTVGSPGAPVMSGCESPNMGLGDQLRSSIGLAACATIPSRLSKFVRRALSSLCRPGWVFTHAPPAPASQVELCPTMYCFTHLLFQ